jgi:hypothetical protein
MLGYVNAGGVSRRTQTPISSMARPEELAKTVYFLASPGDYGEFAQILYSTLREADAIGLVEVVVVQA